MIVFPNAKINLGLRVLRKRPDGYHDLETIFFPVPICDVLELIFEDKGSRSTENATTKPGQAHTTRLGGGARIHFSQSGLAIDASIKNNLVIQACDLFDREYGIKTDLWIHLHKIIPMGAGLGGGSSDAVFTLLALNKLTGAKATESELIKMSKSIGSDCPFFVINRPAFARGRGELLKEINLNLSGYRMIIVKPEIHVSTAEAFSEVIPKEPATDLMKMVVDAPIEKWNEFLTNDFEESVFKKYPEIAEIKRRLSDHGALYAAMSGSGSAVFGIFRDPVRFEIESEKQQIFELQIS